MEGCGRKIGPFDCCTIVEGDCLDVMAEMPDECVDVVVTSPPYNTQQFRMDGGTGRGSLPCHQTARAKKDVAYADSMPESEYQNWQGRVVRECLRIAQGVVCYNHKVRHRSRGGGEVLHPMRWLARFPLWQEVIWNRKGSIAFNCRRFAPSDERIFILGRPHWWEQTTSRYLSIWDIPPVRGTSNHVCPFPTEIPSRCIEAFCPSDGIAFDPFMGSGTTAEAAEQLGRHFFGCDINPEYVAMAEKRLSTVQLAMSI